MSRDERLDWDRFISGAGDNESAAELVTFYLDHTSEELAALDASVRRGSVAEVELIAHRLAATSATAGARAMVAPLVALEEMAQAGSLAGAKDAVALTHVAFAEIRALLAARTSIGKG